MAYSQGSLAFAGKSLEYESRKGFKDLIDDLYKEDWVLYLKKPFAGPQKALDYLSRYTFRTAISNERIKYVRDGKVTFTYRDRRDSDRKKEATLEASEFIRRFLLHVLPGSFTRIRHFGFVSNRNRKENIACLKKLMGAPGKTYERLEQSLEEIMLELTGKDILKCPHCKVGIMALHHLIPRFSFWIDRNFCGP